MSSPGWLLIAPAEDWRNPFPLEEANLGLLQEVAQRLSLRMTRDDAQKKFYLGLPQAPGPQPEPADAVRYPSGKSISKVRLSEAEAARYGTTGLYAAASLLAARVDDPLSKHFQAGEFMPHDSSYRYLRVSPHLVEALEKIRTALGDRPLTIHSAYRPPAYNRQVGGVANSAHIDGLAADLSVEGVSTAELHRVCEKVMGDSGGVGYYPTQQFVHIDVRGSRSRWTG